ncbi:serine carboxypeptidase 20-like protein, partial [Trifolium pratense]
DVQANCKENYNYDSNTGDDTCSKSMEKVDRAVDGLNVYNILEPCYHDPEVARNKSSNLPLSFQNLGKTERPLPVRKRMFGRAWPFRAPVRDGPVTLWPQLMANNLGHVPCLNDEVAIAWLNNVDVRKAIHVNEVYNK